MNLPLIRRGLVAVVAGLLLCSCADKAKEAALLVDSARAKANAQDFTGALADLDKAVQLQPEQAELYVIRGAVKGGHGDFDQAITDFSKAISLKPAEAEAYGARGMAEHDKGDLTASLADLNKALEIKPEAAGFEYRAGLRQSLGDAAGAFDDYNKAIEKPTDLDPHVRMLCLYRAALARRLGPDTGGLTQIIGAWPNDWLTTIGLFLNGKISEPDFLASAEKDTPKNVPERECRADYFVGMLHLANHDNVGARKYFSMCGAVENVNAPEQEFAHGELKQIDKASK